MGLALIRMIIHYCEIPESACGGYFGPIFRVLFSFVLQFQVMLFGLYVFLIFTWSLLAAVLNPEVYLVYGVAVTVIVVVITMTYNQLMLACSGFKSLISVQLDKQMKQAMDAAVAEQARKAGVFDHGDAMDSDINGDGIFDARDLFHMLNRNEDGTMDDVLTIDEFRELFVALNIDISEEKQDKLLALCDIDCSETIDEEEFVNAWDYFHEVFLEEAASQAGLSWLHVFTTVVLMTMMILLVFAFVFVAMAAWSNENNFVVVIRSLIITFMGGATSIMRPKGDIERGDASKTQASVEESMNQLKKSKEV